MLLESEVAQIEGEPRRQWFRDEFFDLVVWYEAARILGFQLCYDTARSERAITWLPDRGYSHDRVDANDDAPTRVLAPMLVPIPSDSLPKSQLVIPF